MELECLTPEFPQGARIYSVDGVAPSLLNSASAMRSQGFLVCGGGDSMKICESKPVICRASGQASADTLDNTCPCLTCDHEAPIVAGSYCLAGNMIDRNTGMNGTGVDENVTFTLNTVDRHAVAYDARHHCLNGNVSGTLQAKGEGGWSLNYINPVIQPLPEATGADTYNGTVTGEVAATLTKVNGVATSGPKVIQAGEKGSQDWIVRRLIPLECGRLQGFPDGWAEIAPLTSPQEFPFWREVYARDCEIKGKRPSRKIVQGGSTESDKALMRWHDGLHSMAAEYAMWGNGMALPNALFFVKNAFRELGKPAEDVKLGSLFDGSGTMPLCAVMCGGAVPYCRHENAPAAYEAPRKREGCPGRQNRASRYYYVRISLPGLEHCWKTRRPGWRKIWAILGSNQNHHRNAGCNKWQISALCDLGKCARCTFIKWREGF